MARLNIDDSFWLDPRVQMLQHDIGENEAVGQLVRFWKLAQLYWGKGELVPPSVFKFHNLSEKLFHHDLAETRPKGIYAKGSEEQFDWYRTKCDNGKYGKLGGRPKKIKHIDNPQLTQTKPTETPPSPSPSPSLNTKEDTIKLILIWGESLKARGLNKNAKWDEVAITRLNLRHGFEKTALALEGARFEPDSEKFKATAHMTVQRLLDKPAFFESSVNRALENKPVERKTAPVEI